ncbi:MAG: cyclase family protein [Thaumarchaeota archaeon]|nr:cyclase family protein [Nitrososphaerota archaeon]
MNAWYPSRWGAEDEIGALNLVKAREIARAASLARIGKVYNLGRAIAPGIPIHPFHGPMLISTYHRHSESLRAPGKKNDAGGMNTRLEMSDHTGTHIDGLNHISIGERLYNGHVSDQITGAGGTSKLGMEKTPAIFTRGVMLDVAALRGVDVLGPGEPVGSEDLRTILAKSGKRIMRGDAVLVATGWGRLWGKDDEKYGGPCPGINLSAAEWLTEKGAVVFGADTWNGEVDPTEDQQGADAVHQHMLAKSGVRIIENMYLEELQRDGVVEFLFVCLPLRLKGATGSPVTPIAVV